MLEFISAWHGKTPKEEDVPPNPKCFTRSEWMRHYTACSAETGKEKLGYEQLMKLACDGCQSEYQKEQLRLGNCHPINFGDTPLWAWARETDE